MFNTENKEDNSQSDDNVCTHISLENLPLNFL